MKTILNLNILIAFSTLVLLTQCKKNDIIYNSYFYTTMPSSETELSLYLDKKYRGEIPYVKNKPTCDNDTSKQKALFLNLKPGKYKLEAKNKQGDIKSSATIKVTEKILSASSGGGGGGTTSNKEGECLIIGVFY